MTVPFYGILIKFTCVLRCVLRMFIFSNLVYSTHTKNMILQILYALHEYKMWDDSLRFYAVFRFKAYANNW